MSKWQHLGTKQGQAPQSSHQQIQYPYYQHLLPAATPYVHQGVAFNSNGHNTYSSEGYHIPPNANPSPVQVGKSPLQPQMHHHASFGHARSSSMPQNKVESTAGIQPSPMNLDVPLGPKSNETEEAWATNTASQSVQQPLRRGQACQACRRRKLKCDAIRPVCSTCTRSRKAAASANHASPVPDGDCVYDEGLATTSPQDSQGNDTFRGRRASHQQDNLPQPLDSVPKRRKTIDTNRKDSLPWSVEQELHHASSKGADGDRTKVLERRIEYLEKMLKEANGADKEVADEEEYPQQPRWKNKNFPLKDHKPAVPIFSMLSPYSGKEEKHRLQYSQRPSRYPESSSSLKTEIDASSTGLGTEPQDTSSALFDFAMDNSSQVIRDDQIRQEVANYQTFDQGDDSLLQLLWPGWSTDLPNPDTVLTICEIFFRQHPMRSLIYKPSFMSGLSLPSKHPHRPHDSLIHAILATTADISPFHQEMNSSKNIQDRLVLLLSDARSRTQRSGNQHLSFKEFHLSKAREKVEYSLITDFRNPLDWIAACLLSCYTLWNDFRITESYFLSAILSRCPGPVGLDKLASKHFVTDAEAERAPGLVGPAEGIEEHERRIIMWHIFIADGFNSGAPIFYENMITEAGILTHLPCSIADFQAGKDVAPNSQTLSSPDLFRTGHLDDFTLHIKSMVLVRRATTFYCRHYPLKKKPAAGLNVLDKQIGEFLASFPKFDFNDRQQENIRSVDKLAAWNNISLAFFYLHEPYLTPTSITSEVQNPATNPSVIRVNQGVEMVLETIHSLMNSSFEFALLHPQIFLTWSVCARMLAKDMDVLKRRGQAGEEMVQIVMEKLQWIILALERGGEKNLKARRCAELVSCVRSGTVHESILSQLLYTDGVIPMGDEENGNGAATSMDRNTALDAMMMPANSNQENDQTISPLMDDFDSQAFSAMGEFQLRPDLQQQQQQQRGNAQAFGGNDLLLNFSL